MVKICDNCVRCGECYETCPFKAIEEPGKEWVNAEGKKQKPISTEHYFINPAKCRKCLQCVKACPFNNIKASDDDDDESTDFCSSEEDDLDSLL